MTALFEPRTADPASALRRALGAGRKPGRVFGVEHEFGVFRDGAQIDFRELIHELAIDGRALHPTNPFHYLTRDGTALIADGIVAEIATPPVELTCGFAGRGATWAGRALQRLEAALPPGHTLTGGSTHLNFSVDARTNDRLALLFARRFSPALMLLMDQAISPGLLVRPRPGRLELCGEYVHGESLVAATVLARGCIGVLEAHLESRRGRLPELLDIGLEPGRRRYGWYVDRAAFGVDLYAGGREAELTTATGGRLSAGAYLERTWDLTRAHAARTATAAELDLVDRRVSGALPLPLESGRTGEPLESPPCRPHPAGLGVRTLRSGAVTLSPRCTTWDWAAWEATTDRGTVIVEIPRPDLAAFASEVERGSLDDVIGVAAERRAELAALAHVSQLGDAAFFSDVEAGPGVLPDDRYGIGGAAASTTRPGKRDLADDSSTRTRPRARSATAAALVAVAALVASLAQVGRPASAGSAELQDPRSLVAGVDPIDFGDGELWLVFEFDEPWDPAPPDDLFSFFFEATFTVNGAPGTIGWETHDAVPTPLGAHQLVVLDDGRVAGSTGLSVDGSFVAEGLIRSGSWRDELTTDAVFDDRGFSVSEDDLLPSDALRSTEATYDLLDGERLEPPPPPIEWNGLQSIVGPDVPLFTSGDGGIDDPAGDLQDYYGSFDPDRPDVQSVDWVHADFGPQFPPAARADRLRTVCAQGLGPGAAPVCPPDTGPLAEADTWFLADVTFTGVEPVVQAGVAWADPSRPVFDGPPFDPNTGRNTSLDVFSGPQGYDTGTTIFDGTFAAEPTDDLVAVLRNDGVALLLDGDAVGPGLSMPQVFVVTGGGVDLVTLPDTPAGTITIGRAPDDSGTDDGSSAPDDTGTDTGEDPSDAGDDGGAETDTGDADGETDIETDAGAVETDEPGGTATDTSDDGWGMLPWILIGAGFAAAGTGAVLRWGDKGTADATTTIVTGFEKGTGGSAAAVG